MKNIILFAAMLLVILTGANAQSPVDSLICKKIGSNVVLTAKANRPDTIRYHYRISPDTLFVAPIVGPTKTHIGIGILPDTLPVTFADIAYYRMEGTRYDTTSRSWVAFVSPYCVMGTPPTLTAILTTTVNRMSFTATTQSGNYDHVPFIVEFGFDSLFNVRDTVGVIYISGHADSIISLTVPFWLDSLREYYMRFTINNGIFPSVVVNKRKFTTHTVIPTPNMIALDGIIGSTTDSIFIPFKFNLNGRYAKIQGVYHKATEPTLHYVNIPVDTTIDSIQNSAVYIGGLSPSTDYIVDVIDSSASGYLHIGPTHITTKTTVLTLGLTALSASNDNGLHIKYKFYHSDSAGNTLSVVTALIDKSNDSVVGTITNPNLSGAGIIDTGIVAPHYGTYGLYSWAFDDHWNFISADTLWVTVMDKTEVKIISAEQNPEGTVKIFSIDGKLLQSFDCYFDDRNKFSRNNIPNGIYITEFISKSLQTHVTEQIGIIAP